MICWLTIDLPFPSLLFSILHHPASASPNLPTPTLLCTIQPQPMGVLLLSLVTHSCTTLCRLRNPINYAIIAHHHSLYMAEFTLPLLITCGNITHIHTLSYPVAFLLYYNQSCILGYPTLLFLFKLYHIPNYVWLCC